MTPLRLEADDPGVLARTGLALLDAAEIPDPPLRLICRRCGALLARAGDTPHGPLFMSWWKARPGIGYVIVHGGQELKPREAKRWRDEHEKLLDSGGQPMQVPVRHGVCALLAPPADMAQDFPDLLVRCEKHGDATLDRHEVLRWLRQAAREPMKRKVGVTKPFSDYRPPRPMPGPFRRRQRRETRRLPLDEMSWQEMDDRLAERHRRDTP